MNQMKKKSPIKGKPLRYVGQSLDERIDYLINDRAVPYYLVCFLLVYLAGYEWWRYFKNPPPSPKTVTFFAVLFVIYGIYKWSKIIKEIKNIKLGRDGERVVGQYLDNLREKGHRIFHDLLGDNFNLDHVIISTKGIFVIETKTYSKPESGEAKIHFDGEKISIEAAGVHTKPIIQVTASSKWLKDILSETTGKIFEVKPVILFPGWFVESTGKRKKSDIWVLNPKALPTYIDNLPNILSQEDMMLASFHISRYIRTQEAKR
jgi:hypothetical protein